MIGMQGPRPAFDDDADSRLVRRRARALARRGKGLLQIVGVARSSDRRPRTALRPSSITLPISSSDPARAAARRGVVGQPVDRDVQLHGSAQESLQQRVVQLLRDPVRSASRSSNRTFNCRVDLVQPEAIDGEDPERAGREQAPTAGTTRSARRRARPRKRTRGLRAVPDAVRRCWRSHGSGTSPDRGWCSRLRAVAIGSLQSAIESVQPVAESHALGDRQTEPRHSSNVTRRRPAGIRRILASNEHGRPPTRIRCGPGPAPTCSPPGSDRPPRTRGPWKTRCAPACR